MDNTAWLTNIIKILDFHTQILNNHTRLLQSIDESLRKLARHI